MYNIRENYVVNDIMFPRKLYQYQFSLLYANDKSTIREKYL